MKLLPEVRQGIFERYHAAQPGSDERNISALAREYGVSRQYIQFIIRPERVANIRRNARKQRNHKHE